MSAARVGYKLLVSPDISFNGGSYGPLNVEVRDGSLLAAQELAACQYHYSSLGMLIDLVFRALAPVMPDWIAVASDGESVIVHFTGDDSPHLEALRDPRGHSQGLGCLERRRRGNHADQLPQRGAEGSRARGPRYYVPAAGP